MTSENAISTSINVKRRSLTPLSSSCNTSKWRPTLLAFAVAQALSAPAQAARIYVNDSGDAGTANTCTLRQAVISSNDDAAGTSNCVAGSSQDTLYFSADVIEIGTISLSQATALNITDNIYIKGPKHDPLVIDGMVNGGVFSTTSADATFYDLTITGGHTVEGGGIQVFGDNQISLTNCTVSGNSATQFGGGLAARYQSYISLKNTIVTDNFAGTGSTVGLGGGLFTITDTTLSLNNTTVSGNSALNNGGGIWVSGGIARMRNNTVSGNSAGSAGGIYIYDSSITSSYNIIAGNAAATGSEILVSSFDSTSLISSSYNLLGRSADTTSQALANFAKGGTDITATSDGTQPTPLAIILEPLADNGGTTLTHALPSNSPAIGAASVNGCDTASFIDQRNFPRSSVCDIGAFEAQTSATIIVGSSLDGTGNCTLRDAIESSNSNTAVGGCVAGDNNDLIVFDPSDFPPQGSTTVTLSSSLPTITSHTTIMGPGKDQLVIDADQTGRVLYLKDATVSISDLSITGGSFDAYIPGAGILLDSSSLAVSNALITNNKTPSWRGGGIYGRRDSSIAINNTTLSNNSAAFGGAIVLVSRAKLDMVNSTVSGNRAMSDVLRGAGLYVFAKSSLNLSNSTVSGNSSDHEGGGVAVNDSRATISNTTISNNSAAYLGAGLMSSGYAQVNIINSVVAGNAGYSGGAEIFTRTGGVISSSHNVFGDDSNSSAEAFVAGFTPSITDITATSDGTDPTALLGILNPLADNEGSTQTHELVAGSPAIGAGDRVVCKAEPVNGLDQRGEKREQCDSGSFETEGSQFFVVPMPNGKSVTFSL